MVDAKQPRFHVTFRDPVRIKIGSDMRSTLIVAVDAVIATEDPYDDVFNEPSEILVVAAIYPQGQQVTMTKMATRLRVMRHSISSMWPLP